MSALDPICCRDRCGLELLDDDQAMRAGWSHLVDRWWLALRSLRACPCPRLFTDGHRWPDARHIARELARSIAARDRINDLAAGQGHLVSSRGDKKGSRVRRERAAAGGIY